MSNLKWFWLFLKTRSNWIFWIVFLHLILLGMAYIDYDISIEGISFIVMLNLGLTVLFLVFTFLKEVKLYQHLYNNKEIEEIKHKDLAEDPFQREVVNYLYRKLTSQKERVVEQQLHIKMTEQSLTEFVHDIKTPVTAMKLLIDQEAEGTRKKALLYEWARINELLDKQLYLTRLESKKRDMYFEETALKRLVIDEIQLTRHISQAKGIGYDLNFETNLDVYTDVKWCRMMIRQILSNSLKYSQGQDIVIRSFIKDDHVALEIKDFGRGISHKDLPRIFERGFTSTANRNETTSSGIGLYLVNSVKEQLGIDVRVTSTVGQGTTFVLTFPKQNELMARMTQVTTMLP
ncbi:sensor histidine kinase [Staphylococcus borealis]|uniref:sensor histidine kinase n=1 Tax=Staphylococcus borealis TaxID=2742203 RepID=UPI00069EF72C|nr:sensor histidine kinase [Staphylococcus borealis]MEB6609030.1 sensor histidine kinase [Staphylococcus borealis]MEB7367102.1 sensor histidine kinase [Staphylococcus borealis]MEB7459195.1 sensor histidine kinase [Staphylococcus borealis]MUN93944.1 sensor histidine kinase [Staphylococcus borealis]NUI79848.1 sensor histidine kinase [Staphylococcus borealis]